MTTVYNPAEKTISYKGEEYYFYNGKASHDWQSLIIARLLDRGFVPNHKTELVEIYLDICSGDLNRVRRELTLFEKIKIKIESIWEKIT